MGNSEAIWVVPFLGQGHMLPSMELCKRLASRKVKMTMIMSSNPSTSVPSSINENPSIEFIYLPSSGPPPPPPPEMGGGHGHPLGGPHHPGQHQGMHPAGQQNQMVTELEKIISDLLQQSDRVLPACVIVDVMMSWSREVFRKFEIPVIGFFTSGACSAAMEYAVWKEKVSGNHKPGEILKLPGLPPELALNEADLKKRSHCPHGGSHGPPPGFADGGPSHPPPFDGGLDGKRKAPPELGRQPPWLDETEGAVALLINTCREQEGPFLDYLANQMQKPVWGVGPLLPDEYWASAGSVVHDQEFRGRRQSSVTEDEVTRWLDRKPQGSVLYVSFGTEVGPKTEELAQLAEALEASNVPFIWAVQNSARPGPPSPLPKSGPPRQEDFAFLSNLIERERGMVIRGWAPQLLILSHPSTGGFLSHCGWNSVMEAVAGGVPILGWPIRGDQYFNSDLVVKYVGVGCIVSDAQKEEIVKGIERLFRNKGIKERAAGLRARFRNGYPESSEASLVAICELVGSLKT